MVETQMSRHGGLAVAGAESPPGAPRPVLLGTPFSPGSSLIACSASLPAARAPAGTYIFSIFFHSL